MTIDISKTAVEEWSSRLRKSGFPTTADLLSALSERVRELERALEGIDVVASRHERGAIGIAQKIARSALNPQTEVKE